jgi:hypothetical protein
MEETHITTGAAVPIPGQPPLSLTDREPVTLDRIPYHPYHTRQQDKQFLGLLAIFHFLAGALLFALCLFMIIYVVMGAFLVSTPVPTTPGGPPGPSPVIIGWAFMLFFGSFGLVALAQGVLTCLTAYYLHHRKRWLFCLVMSCTLCIHGLIGIALGVCSIIVLMRPSVRDLFKFGEPITTDDEDYQ